MLAISTRHTATVLFLFCMYWSHAQVRLGLWGDAGNSNVDANGFTSLNTKLEYTYQNYYLYLGTSALFTEWREKVTNGTKVELGRMFAIKDFPLVANAFYLHKPFSNELMEWDMGLMLRKNGGQWQFALGGHYREIQIRETGVYQENKVAENFNLLYSIRYSIPLEKDNWRLGIAGTNFDHFLLLQETNPMFRVSGQYVGFNKLDLFSEFWYRQAGLFNIQVQYYGYFFRLGAIWHIEV